MDPTATVPRSWCGATSKMLDCWFSFCAHGVERWNLRFLELLSAGTIPVVVADGDAALRAAHSLGDHRACDLEALPTPKTPTGS